MTFCSEVQTSDRHGHMQGIAKDAAHLEGSLHLRCHAARDAFILTDVVHNRPATQAALVLLPHGLCAVAPNPQLPAEGCIKVP